MPLQHHSTPVHKPHTLPQISRNFPTCNLADISRLGGARNKDKVQAGVREDRAKMEGKAANSNVGSPQNSSWASFLVFHGMLFPSCFHVKNYSTVCLLAVTMHHKGSTKE